MIDDGGNTDLAAAVSGVDRGSSGFFFFVFSVVIGLDRRCVGFCSGGILVV